MKRDDKTRASFDYLKNMAESQGQFSVEDLVQHSGWSKSVAEIYLQKKFSGIVKKAGNKYQVDRKILGVPYDRYATLFKQKQKLFVEYSEDKNPNVTIYEFFLPLTLEHVLKQALDELFYKDTVKNRLKLIGIEDVSKIFGRHLGDDDDKFLDYVCEFVGNKFVGYSISHVNGRFRAGDLLDKEEAAKNEKDGQSYIIDETTAVARFIIPHDSVKTVDSIQPELHIGESCTLDESEQTEWLFRNLFVEAVLQATTDQDEIWVLESGKNQKLYRYKAIDRDE